MPIVSSIAGQILDDVYLIETSGGESITGESTDIVGLVGVFQQGIPTAYYEIGDYTNAVKYLGKSLSTIGGPMAIQNLIRQSAGDLRVVPCFGTNAAVASVTLNDSKSSLFGTLTAAQTHPQKSTMYPLYGSGPNSWVAKVTVNTDNTFNLSIVSGSVTENYNKLSTSTWADTVNASSTIVIASTAATPNTNTPAVGNFTFSGGSIGTVTSGNALDAALIGTTNTDGTKTGLTLLAGLDLNFIMAAEYSSTTLNTELADFANENQCIAVLSPDLSTTTPDAVITEIGTVSQDNVVFVDNQGIFYDADVEANRDCMMNAPVCGVAAVLSPQQSWGNKAISGCQGIVYPRSRTELIDLQEGDVMTVSDSIPRGGLGIRNGVATDGSQIYVRRMRYYLEKSIVDSMGWAVDELQSTSANDSLRSNVKQTISTFLEGLVNDSVIDSYLVVCDKTNNPDDQIAVGKLHVTVKVRLLAAAQMIIITADISTSTITTSSTASAS
jgi:phage tail sheath protein FI